MNISLEELAVVYKEIGKIPESKIKRILIQNKINGYYLQTNPVRDAHTAMRLQVPTQDNITEEILSIAVENAKKVLSTYPWMKWSSQDGLTAWKAMVQELQMFANRFKRSNPHWVIRSMGKSLQNKGLVLVEHEKIENVINEIAPKNIAFNITVWKRPTSLWDLKVAFDSPESSFESMFLIYKPTLREVNALKAGEKPINVLKTDK